MNDLSLKYASALYELALEENQLDSYQEQCKIILTLLEENVEFLSVLDSAFLTLDEKNKIVDETLKNISDDIRSLVKIVVSNHRVNYLKDIFQSFNSLANQYKGVVEGLLYSAFPLDRRMVEKIEDAISKKERISVSLIPKLDPSLIGGIKIVINNRVYDGSIKNKLSELKRNLAYKEENSL